jgi:glycosyltransferase A (GT-A) superfamily protein (DUF2064 family)
MRFVRCKTIPEGFVRRLTSLAALPTIASPMRLKLESLASHAPALVVMCTRPRIGGAKVRAESGDDAHQALDLARALVACAIEDAAAWPGPVVLALAQPSDLAWADGVAQRDWSIVGQPSGNPGERINAIDQLLRRHGARSLAFVGTTAPSLNEADYAAARSALETSDVVVTPTSAGGVALMASRRPWPDLATLAWNTKRLGAELAYLCEREGLSVEKRGRRPRVEDLADLEQVVPELASDTRAGRQALLALARRVRGSQPAA